MFKGKVLILDKTDIKEGVSAELSVTDLRAKSLKEIVSCDIAIATTNSGETIVLKNRSGVEGIVVPLGVYREFQNWLGENNSPIEKPEKKNSFWKNIFQFG